MAWTKIPPEHHPIFRAALPNDPRVTTVTMFGGVCGMVNGHMFGGLFGRSAIVRLGDADQREALALDGAAPFDPMGKGRPMASQVMLPESVMDDPAELASWLRRGLEYTATLPKKVKGAKKPAARSPLKKTTAKRPPLRKAAPKKAASRKPASKRKR